MVTVGVIGAGQLGKLILKQLNELPEWFIIVGFHDNDPQITTSSSDLSPWTFFDNAASLIEASDAIILSVPTSFHFFYAKQVLSHQKHLFIEKPITDTLEEAIFLKNWFNDKKSYPVVQVGHIERFNPAWLSVKDLGLHPMFIEVHRLAPFNARGTDVSVVLDLMIHDLDLILQLIPYEITDIRSNGVAILSATPDIANARIEFANGAVANVTSSRISMKKMRKMRLFQSDAYISLDFLEKKSQIFSLLSLNIETEMPVFLHHNALKEELRSFAEAIFYKKQPVVTVNDGVKALQLAHKIIDNLKSKPS
jgi:predicted dehydrogenase